MPYSPEIHNDYNLSVISTNLDNFPYIFILDQKRGVKLVQFSDFKDLISFVPGVV